MNILKDRKKLLLAGAAAAVLAVVVVISFFFGTEQENDYMNEFAMIDEEEGQTETKEPEEIIMKVDIKGAVVRQGVYVATSGDRIEDIVKKAGGFTDDANPESINLAQRVEDQMVIHVLRDGEDVSDGILEQGVAGTTASEEGKININTASETELQTITGIGPMKASTIIQYREEQGPFSSVEDLKKISGIGEKTFEKMKDQVTI